MKRRKFLFDTFGVVSGLAMTKNVFAATPCPPDLDGAPPLSCPPGSGTRLENAATGLAPGQHTPFTPNALQSSGDIKWMTNPIKYDPLHREIHYVGKPASGTSTKWTKFTYIESTDTWVDNGVQFNSLGHTWLVALDPLTGNYYFGEGEGSNDGFMKYDRTAGTTTFISYGNGEKTGAIVYHPNLFGPGRPGLFVWGGEFFYAYDLESDTLSNIGENPGSPFNSDFAEFKNGSGVYDFATDTVVCAARDANSDVDRRSVIAVLAGAGNSTDVLADSLVILKSDLNDFSIPRMYGHGTAEHCKITEHPTNPGRIMLLEGGDGSASKVWTSDNGGGTWALKSYTHPFDDELSPKDGSNFAIGTIKEYGVIIGMSSGSSPGDAHLWKPND